MSKVHRLMREHDLLANCKVCKAKRTPQKSKPRADRPHQFWGIDMTKFMINSVGWVYLVVVLDWYSKKIVGWDLSFRTKTEDWKRALDMALNSEFLCGVRGQGLKLVSDNGCQPTSISFRNTILIYHRGHRVHGGFVVIHFINSVLLCVLCGLK